jgi:protein-S-isoprenylcysteine O-methyltransferase Ste14
MICRHLAGGEALPRLTRGEGWVIAQTVLLLAAAASSFVGPTISGPLRGPTRWMGLFGLIGGAAVGLAGAASLGKSLTPLPRPKRSGKLVTNGPYRFVRHPIYSGVILAALGWAAFRGRWLALVPAAALVPFFDAKASREERWLLQLFPDYADYRARVSSRLIPGLY